MGLRKKPPFGALCLKGPTPPVRWSWRPPPKPEENPAAALADRLRLRVWICSGIKVVVVMCVLRKSLICSRACLAAGSASISRGVKSTEEVENCLWGLSSSVHRLLTLRCRCSRSISLSSWSWGGMGRREEGREGSDNDKWIETGEINERKKWYKSIENRICMHS